MEYFLTQPLRGEENDLPSLVFSSVPARGINKEQSLVYALLMCVCIFTYVQMLYKFTIQEQQVY